MQPLLKTVWRFLKKLGIKLPYDPVILPPGIYPEKTMIEKDTYNPVFTAAIFTITRTWKQPRCLLTDEWRKKVWYIYVMEYYSAIKRNTYESGLMRWMNLESIKQSEASQEERNSYTHCNWRLQKLISPADNWRTQHSCPPISEPSVISTSDLKPGEL